MKNKMPVLKAGDEIRIISSARKISSEELQPAFDFIREKGCVPSLGKNLFMEAHQFAGRDEQRREDLQIALDDEALKVIWMARGGYGTHRIISELDFSKFKEHPKWIVGYSDVTVLHSMINKMGFESLHATMPINMKDQSMAAFNSLFNCLEGAPLSYELKSHRFNVEGRAKGKVLGGNLSIIYSLTGTDILPDLKGSILFFEDLDEYLYHVDRMMMNLKLSGILDSISGLIIGGLSDMNDNTIPFGKSAEEIVYEHTSKLGIPVCFHFPSGHQKENYPIILGREAELMVSKNRARLNY